MMASWISADLFVSFRVQPNALVKQSETCFTSWHTKYKGTFCRRDWSIELFQNGSCSKYIKADFLNFVKSYLRNKQLMRFLVEVLQYSVWILL